VSGKVIPLPPAGLTRQQQTLVMAARQAVQKVAALLWLRYPRVMAWEEMLAIGELSLAEAVRQFEPWRGVPFEAYAWRRVHGAIRQAILREWQWQRAVREGAYKAIEVQGEAQDRETFSDALVTGMLMNLAGEVSRSGDVETDVMYEQMMTALGRALSELSAEDQRLVELHYVKELPLEESGKALSMCRTTVKARHRGLLKRVTAKLSWLGMSVLLSVGVG
jgi:RNA polymerase sigma factor for flagellar operon FliA